MIRIKLWLGAAGAALMALVGVYLAGRRAAQQVAATDALRADAKAHGRINDADIGIGANDADNIAWLQSFHDKHSR